jgi:hypothetical protein
MKSRTFPWRPQIKVYENSSFDGLCDEIIHVKVGHNLKDFGIHKELICHYSPYFKLAFTYGFQETETSVMELSDTIVEVFELFYN